MSSAENAPRPLLSVAVRAHGGQFRTLADAGDAAVAAASAACCQQYEQAAGAGRAVA